MGTLIHIQWRGFVQSFRREAQVGAATLLALMLTVAGAVGFVVGATMSAGSSDSERYWLGSIAIAAGVIAFASGTVGHSADQLNERTVVISGIRPARVAAVTLAAAVFGPRSVLWLVAGLAVGVWSLSGPGVLGGGAAGLLLALTDRLGVVIARAIAERRIGRELGTLVTYLVVGAVVVAGTGRLLFPDAAVVDAIDAPLAAFYRWVPLTAAASAGFTEADAWVAVGIGFAGVALLGLLLWILAVPYGRRAMVARADSGRSRFGFMRPVIGSKTGAVAWRTVTGWLRDPREVVLLLTVMVLPVLIIMPLLVGGVDPAVLLLMLVPMWSLLLGWSRHNDIAYDSTAIWLHVTAGTRGVFDQLGRMLPVGILGTLLLAGGVVLLAATGAPWETALAVGAVSFALLWVSAGGSAIMSVIAPYPVARPDDPPLTQPVRSWGGAVVAHPFAALIEVALCLPVGWLAYGALTEGSLSQAQLALGAAVALGAVVFTLGVIIGGARLDRRGTQLLQFAQSM